MLCRATADGLQGAAGHRAVNWRADGLQRVDGCCAGARGWRAVRWRMVCGEMTDAVQGGRQVLRRTTADDLRGGVARCCAGRILGNVATPWIEDRVFGGIRIRRNRLREAR